MWTIIIIIFVLLGIASIVITIFPALSTFSQWNIEKTLKDEETKEIFELVNQLNIEEKQNLIIILKNKINKKIEKAENDFFKF